MKGSSNDLRFMEDGSSANTRMTIQEGGNVGIGTASPAALLNLVKNSTYNGESSAGFRIEDGTSNVGLLAGTDATNNIADIQSLEPGTS